MFAVRCFDFFLSALTLTTYHIVHMSATSQCLYAFGGTIISAFAVGWLTFVFAQNGLIGHVDQDNAMEPLLFGALISAVDPVATLTM